MKPRSKCFTIGLREKSDMHKPYARTEQQSQLYLSAFRDSSYLLLLSSREHYFELRCISIRIQQERKSAIDSEYEAIFFHPEKRPTKKKYGAF